MAGEGGRAKNDSLGMEKTGNADYKDPAAFYDVKSVAFPPFERRCDLFTRPAAIGGAQ